MEYRPNDNEVITLTADNICSMINRYPMLLEAFKRIGAGVPAGQCYILELSAQHASMVRVHGARLITLIDQHAGLRKAIEEAMPGVRIASAHQHDRCVWQRPGKSSIKVPRGVGAFAIDISGNQLCISTVPAALLNHD